SVIQNGTLTTAAWLGSSGNFRTNAPGRGNFASSSDLGIAEDGTIYAYLRVTGGPDGLFAWNGSNWSSLLRIGDTYDGFPVTSIGTIRVAGKALYAMISATFNHIARYQDGKWSDVVSNGDAIPTGGTIGAETLNAVDVNCKGALTLIT